jgi:hypothetical protein
MKMSVLILTMLCVFSAQAQYVTAQVLAFTNATVEEEIKVQMALSAIEEIVNSDEFYKEVLSMSYKIGKKTYRGFSQTKLSSEEVLKSIYSARENFPGGAEHSIDLYLNMYYERSSTIGWTAPKEKFIHMNRYHHDRYSLAQTAGNLFHEWLHKINHDHSKRHNSLRPHSVPYKLGQLIAEKIAERESPGDRKLKAQYRQEFKSVMTQDCEHGNLRTPASDDNSLTF